MNIVENQATEFVKNKLNDRFINTFEKIKSELTSKLYQFNKDRDKLDFLKTCRKLVQTKKEQHLEICQKPNCGYPESKDLELFIIDQEIDEINNYYTFEAQPDDKFTPEEESDLHSKLNGIIEKLEKLGYGQEIIFEEVESLKDHFNLGKKTWFQLVKGKVIELTIKKVLDETIVKEIYNNLCEGYNEAVKLINN